MKQINNKFFYSFTILLILTLILISQIFKTSNAMPQTYSREQIQSMVISTGMSYFYNKTYSEYDQKAMDAGANGNVLSSSMNWRQFYNTPEMVNRANYYHIDCSSFVAMTYMHSLGYDFSENYKSQSISYYKFDKSSSVFQKLNTNASTENFITAYSMYGKGISTAFYTNLGRAVVDNKNGNEYIIDQETQDGIVAYYYGVTGNETTAEKEKIKNNILNILQPGDIVVYRNKTTEIKLSDDSTSTSEAGHAMLYIGTTIDEEGGFIHSTGADYVIRDDGTVSVGDDNHSVRYDGMYKLEDILFLNNTTTTSTIKTTKNSVAFTVLRPINKYCDNDICSLDSNTNKNIQARTELLGLRVEQYASSYNPSVSTDYSSTKCIEGLAENCIDNNLVTTVKNNWSTSKYNSVNKGDEIQYSLYLKNDSKINFCKGNGLYLSETTCTNANLEWKESSSSGKTFTDFQVIALVPANAEYVKCSGGFPCKYSESTKTVTWTINSSSGIDPGQYYTLRYTVKVLDGDEIINEGMRVVTTSGQTLQMAPITTSVNPTMSKLNVDDLLTNIIKFDKLNNAGQIIYDSSGSSGYKINLNDISSAHISQYGFINTIYYNTLGIDIGFLSATNIKNAIFNKDTDLNYAKKTEAEIASLTDEKYKKINQMLVKGFYGGRYIRGNDNGDRRGRLRITDLEAGDIIISFYTSNETIAESSTAYMYLGTEKNTNTSSSSENQNSSYFVRFESDNDLALYTRDSTKTSYTVFNELYSKDLFVVLRPTQLYGTTVNYEGATAKDDETTTVEYSTYKHLQKPTEKEHYTVTFVYGKELYSCNDCKPTYEGIKAFDNWYGDSNYKTQISNGDALLSSKEHKVYAKWDYTNMVLPTPKIAGYTCNGWYKDSNYSNKVGNIGDNYKISSTTTLYAKWTANQYNVIYNANGGIGSMDNSIHTYDENKQLSKNLYTKEGYIFIGWSKTKNGTIDFQDGQEIINLTTGSNITLYAVWEKENDDIKTVSITVENGTADSLRKTVTLDSIVSFTLYPKVGHGNLDVSCSGNAIPIYGDINDSGATSLTIKNIYSDTTCTARYLPYKYTIKYEANGGIGTMSESTHVYGIAKQLSKNIYTKNGYVFRGWSTAATGNIEYIDEENVINLTDEEEQITLYAQYSPKTYTINYSLDGGLLTDNIATYNIESSAITLPSPSKNGYNFIGWTGSNGTIPQKSVVIPTGSTGNKTYKANWEVAFYTINYNSDQYGTITGIISESLKYNSNPTGTTKVIHSDYKHLKWVCNKDVTLKSGKKIFAGDEILEEEIKNIMVTCDLTLTAYHYKNKYKISYNPGVLGTISGENYEEVGAGSSPLGKEILANNGYKFSHWISDKDILLTDNSLIVAGTVITKSDLTKIVMQDSITLTAIYKYATYVIKYQAEEYGAITGIDIETKLYLENPSSSTTKTVAEDYIFSHWVADKDVVLTNDTSIAAGNKITPEQIPQIIVKTDLTFTAKYIKNIFTIYYKSADDITIIGITKEKVKSLLSPQGTIVQLKNQQKSYVWISDKDVRLLSGITIKAGEAITSEQVPQIVVDKDMELTAKYREDLEANIPNTGIKLNIIILVSSLLLMGLGIGIIYLIVKKHK